MPKWEWIAQSEIEVRWDLNPRERDDDHIRALATHMNRDGFDVKQPLVVYEETDYPEGLNKVYNYFLAAGHHRIEASLLEDGEFPKLPLGKVYCEIRKGTRSEILQYMLIDNFQHTPGFNKNLGKMPTRDELRKMRYNLFYFENVLSKGDRLLAKEWGCDHKTVGNIRDEFIEVFTAGEKSPPFYISNNDQLQKIIEDGLYLGLDGKKHPRTKVVSTPEEEPEPLPEKSKRCYARIIHHNEDVAEYSNVNHLFFNSREERTRFELQFEIYHSSHEHDGKPPSFENITTKDMTAGQKEQARDASSVDYDGWFGPEKEGTPIRYFPPTCIIEEESEPIEESDDIEPVEEVEDSLLAQWNAEWFPKVAMVFEERGVLHNSVRANIARGIKKEFGDDPYSLSDENLEQLIEDAKIIIDKPEGAFMDKWWRDNDKAIIKPMPWADYVLSKAVKEEIEEEPEIEKEESGHGPNYQEGILKGFDPNSQRWLRVTLQIGRDQYGHSNISAYIPEKYSHTIIKIDELSDDEMREITEELAEIAYKMVKIKKGDKEQN